MNKTVEVETGAKKAKKTSAVATGFPTLAGAASPADIGDALVANRAMMDEMVATNHEINAFVGKRMRSDVDAFARLCRCRDWPEAMGVQIDFMSKLTEDYFAEASKLMERAVRMMESGPIRSGRVKKK